MLHLKSLKIGPTLPRNHCDMFMKRTATQTDMFICYGHICKHTVRGAYAWNKFVEQLRRLTAYYIIVVIEMPGLCTPSKKCVGCNLQLQNFI